jgi:hypothetical protein
MSPRAVEIVAPTAALIATLAERLRAQDLEELRAAGWSDPHAALTASIERSRWSCLALIDGEPAALYGCAEQGTALVPIGVPWMLGTELVPRHARVLQRYARAYIAAMLADYPRLYNAVHARNTVAVRWLKRLGFQFGPAVAVPPHGELFHPFEMRRDV